MFRIWPDVFLEANLIDPVFDFGEEGAHNKANDAHDGIVSRHLRAMIKEAYESSKLNVNATK